MKNIKIMSTFVAFLKLLIEVPHPLRSRCHRHLIGVLATNGTQEPLSSPYRAYLRYVS